jgi:hypothetical protein
MEENKKQYLSLMSEIIDTESVILGQEIAILKAKRVASLVLNNNGKVFDINGYGADAVQELINEYVELSGHVADKIIENIFKKYPQINPVK